MRIKTILIAFAVASLCSAAPALASSPSTTPRPDTPNACIDRNHGDWNACNVGNSGGGDLPYQPTTSKRDTPNDCIKRNHGDWNACNVGNSGGGDLPYKPYLIPSR